MARWMIAQKRPLEGSFGDMAGRFGIRDITARLMVNRGVNTIEAAEAYLNGSADMLRDPRGMADIEKGRL